MRVLEYPKDRARIDRFFRHASTADAKTEQAVRAIIESVRRGGNRAVASWTRRLDGVQLTPGRFKVMQYQNVVRADPLEDKTGQVAQAPVSSVKRAESEIDRIHAQLAQDPTQVGSGDTHRRPEGQGLDAVTGQGLLGSGDLCEQCPGPPQKCQVAVSI